VDAVSGSQGPSPGQADGDFAARVRAAQADIAQGVERAGWRDDPLRHPMAALSTTIGVFPPLVERIEAIAAGMKRPISDDELNRLQATIIRGADRRAADLARAHNLRTLLIYGGAFVTAVVLAAGGGFWLGQAAAADDIQQTDERLALAFRDGPDAAAGWVKLMELNNLPGALAQCTGPRAFTDRTGRKACYLPVYVEPPTRPVPSQAAR